MSFKDRILELFVNEYGHLANQNLIFMQHMLSIDPNLQLPEHTHSTCVREKLDYLMWLPRLGVFIPMMDLNIGVVTLGGTDRVFPTQETKDRHIIFSSRNDQTKLVQVDCRLRGARNSIRLVGDASSMIAMKVIEEGGHSFTLYPITTVLSMIYDGSPGFIDEISLMASSMLSRSKRLDSLLMLLSNSGPTDGSVLSDDEWSYINESIIGSANREEVVSTILVMMYTWVSVVMNNEEVSDRDHCGNKAYQTTGVILHSLLERARRKKTVPLHLSVKTDIFGVIKTGVLVVGGKQKGDMVNTFTARNKIDELSSVRKVLVPADLNSMIPEMRQYHRSQSYYMCPCETPDGKGVGLVRSLSLTCLISPNMRDMYDVVVSFTVWSPVNHRIVFYNGMVVGFAMDDSVYDRIRRYKRSYPYMSVWTDDMDRIYVRTYEGRLMKPVYVVSDGDISKLSLLGSKALSWNSMIDSGIIELLDPWEADSFVIADDNFEGHEKTYDRMELHPLGLFGIAAASVPFINHNASTRGTFAASMMKQALSGVYDCIERPISNTMNLIYGQRPLVHTLTQSLYDIPPMGVNLVFLIASYGYNQEDAIVINEGSLRRGVFGKLHMERKRHIIVDGSEPIVSIIDGPDMSGGVMYESNKSKRNIWVTSGTDDAYTSKLYRQANISDNASDMWTTRVTIGAVLGDKFASRSGQKGVLAYVVKEVDLPYDLNTGEVPDIIFNPHGIPSRMTMGTILEMVIGRWCAEKGCVYDGSAFKRPMTLSDDMKKSRTMVNGITGDLMHNMSMGIMYYMILPHVAEKKVYSRKIDGPRNPLSGQPISGRSGGGAPRNGEMEKDAILSLGCSSVAYNLCTNSDVKDVSVCVKCGAFPVGDSCDICNSTRVVALPLSNGLVVARQTLMSAGIKVSLFTS